MKLKDRVALVTGGGSGLGRAISLLFAEEGAHVVVNELRLEAAEQTVASMKGPAGGRAIQADVSDSAQVKAMFATIERELGALDILVNNAGIAFGPGDDRAEVNRKSEAIVMELLSGHGAQAPILAFTRPVARDVASRGIRVNAICPGYIDTPMTERMSALIRAAVIARTPLRRTGEPHEVAATALFLASDDSSFFTGQWLSPNGGLFIA